MRAISLVTLVSVVSLAGGQPLQAPQPRTAQAHFEARKHKSEYHGPGREETLTARLTEVRIGYFGPFDPDHPEGGDAWLAANLAIEEENLAGGYQDLSFRLMPAWADSPWGTGIAGVTQMIYRDRVWAVIGSIDGSATHLAEQVVAKARVALLNPGSYDKTVNLANVPWMFSLLPGEHLQVPVLVHELQHRFPGQSFSILSSVRHDARVFARELLAHLASRSLAPDFHFQFSDLKREPLDFIRTAAEGSEILFVVADARETADLLGILRKAGFGGPIFGTPSMGRREFLSRLPDKPGTLIFPSLAAPPSEKFAARFRERSGGDPDYVAAQTYDAVRLLAGAIRKAGFNRALIRDAVRELPFDSGQAGLVDWDPLGHNRRPVQPATIRDRKVHCLGAADGLSATGRE